MYEICGKNVCPASLVTVELFIFCKSVKIVFESKLTHWGGLNLQMVTKTYAQIETIKSSKWDGEIASDSI